MEIDDIEDILLSCFDVGFDSCPDFEANDAVMRVKHAASYRRIVVIEDRIFEVSAKEL